MEKNDSLQVELEKEKQALKEIRYNSIEARQERKIARIESQIREKEMKKVRKELEKAIKKSKKASKVVDKISAKRQEVAMSGVKWEGDKLRANADVQRLVAQELQLRTRLKELERAKVDRQESPGFVEIMRGGRTSDKYKDKFEVVSEE